MIALDVDDLMKADRCISGDLIAHSSYRATKNALAIGQAASVTAAVAAKQNRLPKDLSWHQVKFELDKFNTPYF